MPYFAFISGLTKRQPIVVSSIFAVRENALSALPMTNGARVMLSTPPAIDELGFASANRARGEIDGIEPRTAQTVDRRAGHAVRQAGQQRRHARDVAIVLAGLVGAAEEDVIDRGPIDARVALHERMQRDRAEIVGADAGERAAVAADGGANRVADEDLAHEGKVTQVTRVTQVTKRTLLLVSPVT